MLSGRTLRSGLQTGFQPVACSLCADGVRRYSARINAFILLPLYYSGAAQGSQGKTRQGCGNQFLQVALWQKALTPWGEGGCERSEQPDEGY